MQLTKIIYYAKKKKKKINFNWWVATSYYVET